MAARLCVLMAAVAFKKREKPYHRKMKSFLLYHVMAGIQNTQTISYVCCTELSISFLHGPPEIKVYISETVPKREAYLSRPLNMPFLYAILKQAHILALELFARHCINVTLFNIAQKNTLSTHSLSCSQWLFCSHTTKSLLNQGGESIEDQILEQCLQRGANAAPKLHIICSIQESQIKLSNNKMAHKCSVHYCYIYCTDQKSMGEKFLSR